MTLTPDEAIKEYKECIELDGEEGIIHVPIEEAQLGLEALERLKDLRQLEIGENLYALIHKSLPGETKQ